MYILPIARKAIRLAMILLFILALAGCGDDAGDTAPPVDDHDEHMDEHDDGEEHAEVIDSFDDHDGFEKGQSAHFSQSMKLSSHGRYGFVLQRSGHLAPDNPSLEDNRIYVVDSGLAVEEHGDHVDPVTRDPSLLPYQLGHGGGEAGEEGLYNPVHFVSHHGLTAIFYDGINPYRENSDPDAVEQNGYAVVYRDSDFDGSTMPPMPIFEYEVKHYSHGAVVPVHDELFIVTLAEPEGALPNGVATYSAHEHGDHVDVELERSFAGRCPGLHGEATWGPYVAFTCYRGDGILVLTHDDETDSLEATVVAYPGEYTSGGLAATTRHEVGHDDVIFMVRYGEYQQDFVKITEHDIEEGSADPDDVLTMEWGSTDRHRAFAFEPVEGSAGRLLIQDQDADGEDYHLDVFGLGDVDHDIEGEGRFVVLTATGDLHIFDLTTSDEPTTMPGIVGAECPEGIGCPSLALAPGFAYVSDPANGKVYEVHLEDAEIERTFDEGLSAPTQLVVLGRFGDEEIEHSHARNE